MPRWKGTIAARLRDGRLTLKSVDRAPQDRARPRRLEHGALGHDLPLQGGARARAGEGELTAPSFITAINRSLFYLLIRNYVSLRLNFTSAPWTAGQLVGGALAKMASITIA